MFDALSTEPTLVEWLGCLAVLIVLVIGFTVARYKSMKEDDHDAND